MALELKKPLFERVGGPVIVEAAVIGLYKRIMDDPQLGPFFDTSDVISIMKKQRDFLTFALGGPSIYTGRRLRETHGAVGRQGLSEQHFDLVKQYLADTLEELGVPRALIAESLAIVETTRADVLGR